MHPNGRGRASRSSRVSSRGPRTGSRTMGSKGSTRSRRPPSEPEFAESNYITPADARRLTRRHSGHGHSAQHPPECICSICTCGAHKCPPDRVAGRYHDLKSSYMNDFTGTYVKPDRPNRAQYIHKPRPFNGATTNQEDFRYHGPTARRELAIISDNGLGARGLPFEGVTTNQHDFRKWSAGPAQPVLKPDGRANIVADDRDFTSEFNSQFVPKGGAKRRSRAPSERASKAIPFDGITTNQADFKHWSQRPSASYMRMSDYKRRPDDRDFLTEGRAEFTEKPFDHCPAVEVAISSKPNNGHVLVERLGTRWIHQDQPDAYDEGAYEATMMQQQQQQQH